MKRVARGFSELLLWSLSLAGLIASVLVICGMVLNTSVILFRTGSMDPTIPAGAAAIVQEIPASDIAVGDVVTVDREGLLPITHRVTSVEEGSTAQERVITMRGDANDSDDPAPYTITEAREVLFSIPGAANVVLWLGAPRNMALIALAAAVLVGWAFWPRRREYEASEPNPAALPPGPATPDGAAELPKSSTPGRNPTVVFSAETSRPGRRELREQRAAQAQSQRQRRVYVRSGALAALVAALTVTALLLAPPATAAQGGGEHQIQHTQQSSSHISIDSWFIPQQRQNMSPGTPISWDLKVSVDADDPGTLSLGVRGIGQLPLNYTLAVCSAPWQTVLSASSASAEECTGELISESTAAQVTSQPQWGREIPAEEPVWLRLRLWMPQGSSASASNTSALVELMTRAAGEQLQTVPKQPSDTPGKGSPPQGGQPDGLLPPGEQPPVGTGGDNGGDQDDADGQDTSASGTPAAAPSAAGTSADSTDAGARPGKLPAQWPVSSSTFLAGGLNQGKGFDTFSFGSPIGGNGQILNNGATEQLSLIPLGSRSASLLAVAAFTVIVMLLRRGWLNRGRDQDSGVRI